MQIVSLIVLLSILISMAVAPLMTSAVESEWQERKRRVQAEIDAAVATHVEAESVKSEESE